MFILNHVKEHCLLTQACEKTTSKMTDVDFKEIFLDT